MANEAVIVSLGPQGGRPIRFTCASGTAITKGTILALTDPKTVTANTAYTDRFAGIAAADKANNDYSTTIAVYTDGLFDLRMGGAAATAGDIVLLSGANLISGASTTLVDYVAGRAVGKALETTVAGTSETIVVDIGQRF